MFLLSLYSYCIVFLSFFFFYSGNINYYIIVIVIIQNNSPLLNFLFLWLFPRKLGLTKFGSYLPAKIHSTSNSQFLVSRNSLIYISQ